MRFVFVLKFAIWVRRVSLLLAFLTTGAVAPNASQMAKVGDGKAGDALLIQQLQAEKKALQDEILQLEYGGAANYTAPPKPSTACGEHSMHQNGLKPLYKSDMIGKDCRMVQRVVGFRCDNCGYHVECWHMCEMYGCDTAVKCGFKRCLPCFAKGKQWELNNKTGKSCIRCVASSVPKPANPFVGSGNFCSEHCAKMCDLYDR